MWVRRLLFEKYLFIIKNNKTLSKKYYLLIVNQEKIHFLEYLPNIQGNYGHMTDIIQEKD